MEDKYKIIKYLIKNFVIFLTIKCFEKSIFFILHPVHTILFFKEYLVKKISSASINAAIFGVPKIFVPMLFQSR
jgi:hypothetical protein